MNPAYVPMLGDAPTLAGRAERDSATTVKAEAKA